MNEKTTCVKGTNNLFSNQTSFKKLNELEPLESFLNYLDTEFKSDIKLEESPAILTSFKSTNKDSGFVKERKLSDSEDAKSEVSKGSQGKGVHSLRRDIIQKNLIRSIRRYLWSKFTKEYDVKKFGKKKLSAQFTNSIKEFYNS